MFMRVKEVTNRTVNRTTLVNIPRIAVISPYGSPTVVTSTQSLIRFSADPSDSIIVDHSVDDLEAMMVEVMQNV